MDGTNVAEIRARYRLGGQLPELWPPPAPGLATPPWIREIQRRRGEAIWDDGLRPAFKGNDGTFDDPDHHDLVGYHMVQMAADGVVIGGLRATPLEALSDSRVVRCDPARAEHLLRSRGLSDTDVLEIARVWIAPAWRGAGLGAELILASVALGQVLERRMLWCTVGARHGERVFLRTGWELRPEFGVHEVPELADTLRVAVIDPRRPPAQVRDAVAVLGNNFRDALRRVPQSKRGGNRHDQP
jgi:GNAT superfamily N-acetyltransferase